MPTRWFLPALLLVTSIPAAATKQPQTEPRFFESAGVSIKYLDRGEGEAVLLLNGAGRRLEQWPPNLISALTAERLWVIAYDARGVGGSGKPDAWERYGQEDVNDIVRVLDHLSLTRAHLLGYSMGASIASRLVAQQPRRVRSAVPGGWGAGNPLETLTTSECESSARAMEQGQTPESWTRARVAIGFPPPPPPGAEVRKATAAAFQGRCEARLATIAELRRANVPMLAMVGALDGMAPFAKVMASDIPSMKFVVIAGTQLHGARVLVRVFS